MNRDEYDSDDDDATFINVPRDIATNTADGQALEKCMLAHLLQRYLQAKGDSGPTTRPLGTPEFWQKALGLSNAQLDNFLINEVLPRIPYRTMALLHLRRIGNDRATSGPVGASKYV